MGPAGSQAFLNWNKAIRNVLTCRQQVVGHTCHSDQSPGAADSRPVAVRLRCRGAGVSGAVDQAVVAGGRRRGVRHHHRDQRLFCRTGVRRFAVRPVGRSLATAGSALCRAGSAGGRARCRCDLRHEPRGQPVCLAGTASRPAGLGVAVCAGGHSGAADGRHPAGAGSLVGSKPATTGQGRRSALCGEHRRGHRRHPARRVCVDCDPRCTRQCLGRGHAEPAGRRRCLVAPTPPLAAERCCAGQAPRRQSTRSRCLVALLNCRWRGPRLRSGLVAIHRAVHEHPYLRLCGGAGDVPHRAVSRQHPAGPSG